MNLRFNMKVMGNDGLEAGQLDRILVDPTKREVTHIAVRSQLVSEEVLLPLSLVQGNVGDRLLLHAASSDLTNMPRYYDGRTSSPPAERVDTSFVREPADRRQQLDEAMNLSPATVEYGPKTRVALVDSSEGRLVALSTEQYANKISDATIGGFGDHEHDVPSQWIGELRPDTIVVSATRQQVEHLVGTPVARYLTEEPDSPGQGGGTEKAS